MENRTPLISVIVPVYKVEEYLAACVDSILAQTYENLEIILVDDGSPDNCGKICDSYAEKDSRIKVIHKENGGVSSARNAGLEVASGEYVGFVDSDDTLDAHIYAELYKNLTETNSDISICSFRKTFLPEESNKAVWANKYLPNEDSFLTLSAEDALCDMMLAKHFAGYLWNKLFKASVVQNLRFATSVYICEDLLFSAEAILNSNKIVFSGKRLYNYLQRQTSALHRAFDDRFLTYYEAHLKIIEIAKKSPVYNKVKYSLQAAAINCCVCMAYDLLDQKEAARKYIPTIKKNIRRHISKESLAVLHRSRRIQARLLAASYALFRLFFKLHALKRKIFSK